ncbi:hypothetical protein MJK70_09255 [Klebsiella pneumoniae]|nr:hypothetical protein MJK70_09255 [Klebsiella pneumoniae]
MHVVDGEINSVETDNTGAMTITTACTRFAPVCVGDPCVAVRSQSGTA